MLLLASRVRTGELFHGLKQKTKVPADSSRVDSPEMKRVSHRPGTANILNTQSILTQAEVGFRNVVRVRSSGRITCYTIDAIA